VDIEWGGGFGITMTDQPRTFRIEASSGSHVTTFAKLELWKYGTYARGWFTDAQREASLGDAQAKLREIIFAVCAIESYLFEWVRDNALKGEFRFLNHYFPFNQRPTGIVERWKQVINHLYEDGTIIGKPTFGEHYWEEFTDLVDFRNGLVHGRASRPDAEGISDAERPEPTAEQLQQCRSGWAVKVVTDVIKKLHEAVGTPLPDWIGT